MIKPGTTVELDVIHRDAKSATVKAKLSELPDRSRTSRSRRCSGSSSRACAATPSVAP